MEQLGINDNPAGYKIICDYFNEVAQNKRIQIASNENKEYSQFVVKEWEPASFSCAQEHRAQGFPGWRRTEIPH